MADAEQAAKQVAQLQMNALKEAIAVLEQARKDVQKMAQEADDSQQDS